MSKSKAKRRPGRPKKLDGPLVRKSVVLTDRLIQQVERLQAEWSTDQRVWNFQDVIRELIERTRRVPCRAPGAQGHHQHLGGPCGLCTPIGG